MNRPLGLHDRTGRDLIGPDRCHRNILQAQSRVKSLYL